MRRARLALATIVVSIVWSGVPALANGASGRFTDDDDSVHETAIEAMAAAGITLGCNPPGNTMYCPDAAVTRGQMAAFLHRGFDGLEPGPTTRAFVDTGTSEFEEDIAWLASVGVTKGCNPPSDDRFCPDQPVTRGEMAAFIVRALGLGDGPGPRFADDDASVFERDIERLAAAGITRGCNPPANDQFCPERPIVRAEMATFLIRALDLPPRLPELDLINGYQCSKDGLICRATITSAAGRRLSLLEGWDHALPMDDAERLDFDNAMFQLFVNGARISVDQLKPIQGTAAVRRWGTTITLPASGNISIDARWVWEGSTERRTVLTIVVR